MTESTEQTDLELQYLEGPAEGFTYETPLTLGPDSLPVRLHGRHAGSNP